MVARGRSRLSRPALLLTLVASMATGLWLAAAGPVAACSCAQPGPLATYASAEHAIFAGTAGPSDARGVPVRVETWFSGPGAAPIVYLAATSFGDGASCGATKPPVGTSWVWVAYLVPDSDPVTGLCSPHAQLGTPEGAALLADAVTTFRGAPPPGETETSAPESATPPIVPADAAVPILIGTVGIALAVFVGVVAVARRRARSAP